MVWTNATILTKSIVWLISRETGRSITGFVRNVVIGFHGNILLQREILVTIVIVVTSYDSITWYSSHQLWMEVLWKILKYHEYYATKSGLEQKYSIAFENLGVKNSALTVPWRVLRWRSRLVLMVNPALHKLQTKGRSFVCERRCTCNCWKMEYYFYHSYSWDNFLFHDQKFMTNYAKKHCTTNQHVYAIQNYATNDTLCNDSVLGHVFCTNHAIGNNNYQTCTMPFFTVLFF